MEASRKPIKTVGFGTISSSGLDTFMAGNTRLISDKAMILSHQYSSGKDGNNHELVGERKFEDYLHERILNHYQKYTKKSKKFIESKLLCPTNTWITPKEAIEFGLADKIINKLK